MPGGGKDIWSSGRFVNMWEGFPQRKKKHKLLWYGERKEWSLAHRGYSLPSKENNMVHHHHNPGERSRKGKIL